MKRYQYALFTIICYFLALTAAGQKKQPGIPGTLPPDLDAYITKVLAAFEVPGVSVAIVKDGKILLTKGYGVRKLGEATRVDAHTLFLIASNSKAFTTTALAMLVEDGKLKWEDPVIDHLPWFRMSDPYVTIHMTIRDLLVHHSGIGGYAGDIMIFPPSRYTRKELVSKLSEIPLVTGFRTTYAYDNILYLAAGEVVKAVSGMEWEDFIQTRIFDKLGMEESLSRFSMLGRRTNVAMAHARVNGKIQTIEHFRDQAIGDEGDPCGGICSNANDMAKWLITQLDSGVAPNKTRIFLPAATEQLWKIVTPIPISKVPEEVKPSQADFWGYALGFRTYNYGAYQVVGHGGALDGFVSQVAMIPKLKLGIAVLTNQHSTGAYWSIIYHVLDYYMHNPSFDWISGYKKLLDSALVKERQALEKAAIVADPAAQASLPYEKYAGRYHDNLYGEITIGKEPGGDMASRGGVSIAGQAGANARIGLVLRFSKSPQLVADLEHFQHDCFIARFRNRDMKADAYITFSLNPDGSVDQAKMQGLDPDTDLSYEDLLLKRVKEEDTTAMTAARDTALLRTKIMAEFSKRPEGAFGVAFKDLSTGETFFLHEHDNFHAASTMKTPVLIETYRQAAAGKFSLSDSIVVHLNFKSIADGSEFILDSTTDSELDLYTRVGRKMTIRDLLYRMITKSSNLATNMIIEIVGAANVNAEMRSLDANDIRVLRGVEDNKAFQKGLNNTTTAYDLMIIMEHIARGNVVSEKACEEMLDILFDQHFKDKIGGLLPADVRVASKSGSIDGICHDSGIVFLPDGRKYVVVLLSRGIADLAVATATEAVVSRIIYDHVMAMHSKY